MVLLRFLAFAPTAGGSARAVERPASSALQARHLERARAAVPPPAGSAAPRPPVPAATAPTPAPSPASSAAAPRVAPRPAAVDDEPPPWMDEAPFEGEAVERAAPGALRAAGVVPGAADAAPPTATPPLRRTPLGDRWADVVAALLATNAVTALARELAMQAELVLVEPGEGGERWRLVVERETLRAPTLAEKLQAALRAQTGLALQLEVVAGTPGDSPARRDAEAAAQRQREAEAIIHADPLVQSMLAQFATARIVPGSIRPA
jgi:DNA polymerase-3 subunit gamma/tau